MSPRLPGPFRFPSIGNVRGNSVCNVSSFHQVDFNLEVRSLGRSVSVNRLELHKEEYHKQLDRMSTLRSHVQFPTGIAIGLLAGLNVLLAQATNVRPGFPAIMFAIFFFLSTLSLFGALYHIVASFWGYKFKVLPPSDELENYWNVITEHYRDHPDANDLAKSAFEQYLVDVLVECNTRNFEVNVKRSHHLHCATTLIVATAVAAFLAVVPLRFDDLAGIGTHVVQSWEVMKENARGKEPGETGAVSSSNCSATATSGSPPP